LPQPSRATRVAAVEPGVTLGARARCRHKSLLKRRRRAPGTQAAAAAGSARPARLSRAAPARVAPRAAETADAVREIAHATIVAAYSLALAQGSVSWTMLPAT